MHRLLLDVIKDEFDRLGGAEFNSVQALLLYNMGDSELTAGELKTRGYYLGSNVSYNLKKLVDMGYLHYKRSDKDRRSVRVSLTPKGLEARDVVQKLYQRQLGSVEAVGQITADDSRASTSRWSGSSASGRTRSATACRDRGSRGWTRYSSRATEKPRFPVCWVQRRTTLNSFAALSLTSVAGRTMRRLGLQTFGGPGVEGQKHASLGREV